MTLAYILSFAGIIALAFLVEWSDRAKRKRSECDEYAGIFRGKRGVYTNAQIDAHAREILAYEQGGEIEVLIDGDNWHLVDRPSFNPKKKYRVAEK